MPGTSQKESGLPFQGVEGCRAWNGGVAPACYGERPSACRMQRPPRSKEEPAAQDTRSAEPETPSSRLQIHRSRLWKGPTPEDASSTEAEPPVRCSLGAWSLELIWSLELVWSLEPRAWRFASRPRRLPGNAGKAVTFPAFS